MTLLDKCRKMIRKLFWTPLIFMRFCNYHHADMSSCFLFFLSDLRAFRRTLLMGLSASITASSKMTSTIRPCPQRPNYTINFTGHFVFSRMESFFCASFLFITTAGHSEHFISYQNRKRSPR